MKTFIGWLDDRLGVIEFYQKHIAYPLPESFSFWHVFGGLAIGCISIQFLTGFYMIMYYIPEPDMAHESIRSMCNNTDFGALFRNVHRWSATLGAVFLIIHAGHIMARRAFRPPRELNWWAGLLLGSIFVLFLITGIILPWDWRSYWELIIWADWLKVIPVVGGTLTDILLGNFSLGLSYAIHIMLLPVLIFFVLAIHIILFRRIGMSDRV